MTTTPHAYFYTLKGLIASSHPELLEFLTEAERRYSSYDALVAALKTAMNRLCNQGAVSEVTAECNQLTYDQCEAALENAKMTHVRHRAARRSQLVEDLCASFIERKSQSDEVGLEKRQNGKRR